MMQMKVNIGKAKSKNTGILMYYIVTNVTYDVTIEFK